MAHYKIGEFCRLLGISEDTVRYYEKCGLIHAQRDKENGYRYYSDYDARQLMWCRICRGVGIGIEEIRELIHSGENRGFDEFLLLREEELKREIQEKYALLEQIRLLREDAWHAGEYRGTCQIRQMKEVYVLPLTDYDRMISQNVSGRQADNWSKNLPYTYVTLNISQETLEQKDIWSYHWGVGIDASDAQRLYPDGMSRAEKYGGCLCLIGYFEYEEKKGFKRSNIQFILDYARQHRLQICGSAVGKILNRRNHCGEPVYDIALCIPVSDSDIIGKDAEKQRI